MIGWREEFAGPTKIWRTVLEGVLLDKTSIESAFKSIWVCGAQRIAPLYVGEEWNTIRVELLEESGHVRIYPYKFHDQGLAIAGCEIFIPSLKHFIRVNHCEEAAESDEQLEDTINEIAGGIADAADANLCEIFCRLSVRIDVCFSGDDDAIVTRTVAVVK
jgi:hypothetical protein